jgi:hypothetical protein
MRLSARLAAAGRAASRRNTAAGEVLCSAMTAGASARAERARCTIEWYFGRAWQESLRRRDFGGGWGRDKQNEIEARILHADLHGLRRVIEGCCWGDSAATLPACFPNYGCQYGQGASQAPAQAKLCRFHGPFPLLGRQKRFRLTAGLPLSVPKL